MITMITMLTATRTKITSRLCIATMTCCVESADDGKDNHADDSDCEMMTIAADLCDNHDYV